MNVHAELGGEELSSGCRCKAGVQGEPSGDLSLILKTTASRNGLAQPPRRLPIWMVRDCWKAAEQSDRKQMPWSWATQVPIPGTH